MISLSLFCGQCFVDNCLETLPVLHVPSGKHGAPVLQMSCGRIFPAAKPLFHSGMARRAASHVWWHHFGYIPCIHIYPKLNLIMLHGTMWNPMKSHEIPWNPMKSHEIPWNSHRWLTTPKSYRSEFCLHHWRRWSGWSSCLPWSSHPDPEQVGF